MRRLPKDLRDYEGDEATSWNQVTKTVDMRRPKPVITIWAERNGPMNAGKREWSFGGGANNQGPYKGYTMLVPGTMTYLAMSVTSNNSSIRPAASVGILVNRRKTRHRVYKSDKYYLTYGKLVPPIKLNQKDVIDFVTETSNSDVQSAVISVLIELDL